MDLTAQIERREIGNLVIENIPEIPGELTAKLQQYQNVRSASVADWLPGGEGLLIVTRFGETDQFHVVKTPGGMRKQISFFQEPVSGGSFGGSKVYDGFLFRKDIGGNEAYQVFYFDRKTGGSKMLTDGIARNGTGLWSRGGDRFVFGSTKRNNKDYDLFVHRMDDRWDDELIFEGEGMWMPLDWSPNDKKLLIKNYRSINDSEIRILDLETGIAVKIHESDQPVSYGSAVWSQDGSTVFFTSDYDKEFRVLKEYEVETGKTRLISGKIPWDVESIRLSPKGDILAFTVNENGASKLFLLDVKENKLLQTPPALPKGLIFGMNWNPDNERLALSINSSTNPSDAYVLNTRTFAVDQWTFSEVGGLDTRQFVEPERIQYSTFDSETGGPREIPAYYYKPKGSIGPHPVLIYIHGGPEGQFRPNFNPTIQYLVNELGVAVLGPNVRGSAGYGKSFLLLDNGFKREDSVLDIGTLLDWVDEQPELDASRIGVMGGSYGGYMVLASMIHFGERLTCGVDAVGISNFVTFLKNTKSYRRDLRRQEYGDERDPAMREHLELISPTTNAHKINKPMFIIQGLNDPRVPASEAEQMLKAIRKNGGDSWYLLAKDEGHGFRKKSNRDFYSSSVMLFLGKFLVGE